MSQLKPLAMSPDEPGNAAAEAQRQAALATARRMDDLPQRQRQDFNDTLLRQLKTPAQRGPNGTILRPGLGGRRRKTRKHKRVSRKTRRSRK